MDETELHEPLSTNESPAPAEPEQPSQRPASAALSESSCCAGNAHVPPRQPGVYAPITVDAPSAADAQLSDFVIFLKRTWRVWAIAAAVIVGAIAAVTAVQRLSEAARAAQLKRYDRATASLTPDHLIARCGRPAQDTSKEIFPVVLRTVRYEPWIGDPLVFTFSKSAEQQSDWVFLTMKNGDGTKSYDSAESKIAAFSCLDSTK